ASPSNSIPNMHPNHVTAHLRRLGCASASVLLLTTGVAQSTPAGPATSGAEPADSEVVTLSPFVVDAAENEGYRATSTLAGSRIKTELRDVASPITVVTKEYLNDIAAADI